MKTSAVWCRCLSSPYETEGRDSSPSCVLLCFLGNVCVGYNTSRACPRLPIGRRDGEREVVATWAAIRAKSLISSVVGDIHTFITSMKSIQSTNCFRGRLFWFVSRNKPIDFSIAKSMVSISSRGRKNRRHDRWRVLVDSTPQTILYHTHTHIYIHNVFCARVHT